MISKLFEFIDYNFIEFRHFKVSLLSIIWVIFIFVCARIAIRFIGLLIHKSFVKRNLLDKSREYSFRSLIAYVIYLLCIVVALGSIGVDLTYLFAGSAALLVGLGLGLQNVFKDFISGIVLLFEGPFKVGDLIEQNSRMVLVKEIALRSTKVETGDNITIVVPNSQLLDSNIINWSNNKGAGRFRVDVGVAYGSNVGVVRHILFQCAIKHPEISKQHQPLIYLKDFGDSSLDFQVLFWCRDSWAAERIKSDLRFAIEAAFKENNISIPFPQSDIHVKSFPVNS